LILLTFSYFTLQDLTCLAVAPKRKVVGSNPARNGDAAGDFVEKTGSGGIICFQDDLSNGR
jgi:hypothetical protein